MNEQSPIWCPDVTVAAVCKDSGRYLLVEERSKSTGEVVFNQPAGHLEPGESIIQAVIREVLEETCRHFTPQGIVGLYRLAVSPQKTYLRYTFFGEVSARDHSAVLDPDIIATHWLTRAEVQQHAALRSSLVRQCIDDYENGPTFSLNVVKDSTPL